jgi:hypothetical protein
LNSTQSTELLAASWSALGSGRRDRAESTGSTTTTTTKHLDKLDASLEDSVLEDSVIPALQDLAIGRGSGDVKTSPPRKQGPHPMVTNNNQKRQNRNRNRKGKNPIGADSSNETQEPVDNWFQGKGDVGSGEDELMLAVLNGVKHRGGIEMCMDEAGRWRIAWGQLQDGTRSHQARY